MANAKKMCEASLRRDTVQHCNTAKQFQKAISERHMYILPLPPMLPPQIIVKKRNERNNLEDPPALQNKRCITRSCHNSKLTANVVDLQVFRHTRTLIESEHRCVDFVVQTLVVAVALFTDLEESVLREAIGSDL